MSSKGYKRAEYQSDAPTASRIASLARYWGVSVSEATRICISFAFDDADVFGFVTDYTLEGTKK